MEDASELIIYKRAIEKKQEAVGFWKRTTKISDKTNHEKGWI